MLYERIKDLCESHSTTITALEAELGFSRGSLGKLKDGRAPSGDRLQKVADRFGVTVDYLLTGETEPVYYEDPVTTEVAQRMKDDREFRLLFSAARDVKAETLQAVRDYLLFLKKKEEKDD